MQFIIGICPFKKWLKKNSAIMAKKFWDPDQPWCFPRLEALWCPNESSGISVQLCNLFCRSDLLAMVNDECQIDVLLVLPACSFCARGFYNVFAIPYTQLNGNIPIITVLCDQHQASEKKKSLQLLCWD